MAPSSASGGLGNAAGDSVAMRDHVLGLGAVGVLVPLGDRLLGSPAARASTLRNLIWTLSNLRRRKPGPNLEIVRPALGVVARALAHTDAGQSWTRCGASATSRTGLTRMRKQSLTQGYCRGWWA